MYAGNSAEALSHLKKGKLLFENSFLMHWAEGIYYEFKEDYSNALFHYNKSIEQNPNVISILRGKMYILAKMGKNREVEDFINDLEILSVQDLITVSTAYCGLGDKKNCIKYLEMASSAGSLPDDIKVDPRYSIIHDTPQFKVILENFGFNNTFHLY
jgi:tetratricopeptide (TPR) repeat protein